MNNYTKFSIVAAPSVALGKLSRAGIPVYRCTKQGAYFSFSVKEIYSKKVFAIFAHPCYNIRVQQKGLKSRVLGFAVRRIGLIAGAFLFAIGAYLSNNFIFRISITGSGAYLENSVRGIIYSLGVREFSYYRGINKPALISGVLSLPSVTFCSVKKSGSTLVVDVQAQDESAQSANYSSLVADADGVVKDIAAVSGTVLVSEGQSVKNGQTLIAAYYESKEGEQVECLAAGYAILEVSLTCNYFAAEESQQNCEKAYASVLLYSQDEEITQISHTVKKVADGVVYVVDFSYLHTLSINFD